MYSNFFVNIYYTMERKVGLQQMTEVPTKIDYWGLQVPTYESNFSINPRWRNNEDDPFICTAVFKKSYVERINAEGGTLSRSADNMLPAFFVYESDTLPIPEQLKICKSILNDTLVASWIFSQTYSGSKSIHTLVYIAPEFRESITKDFKYYWREVGERIFGENMTSMLDQQCASIARLSRNPNGIRVKDNGEKIKQTCIYYNPESLTHPINLSGWITEHTKFLEQLEIKMQADAKKRMEAYANAVDEKKKLEGIYNKGNCSESFKLAYKVLVEGICPQGGKYISAASSLHGCGFSKTIIREMLERASAEHPTNISQKRINQIIDRL